MRHFTQAFGILFFIFSVNNFIIAQSNSCSDGHMNGSETGIDCGGPSCSPCPCTESKLLLQQNSYDSEFHRNSIDWVRLRDNVVLEQGSHAAFSSMNFIELSPTFEVKQGSEVLFTIDNCVGQAQGNIINQDLFLETEECGTLFKEPSAVMAPCTGPNPPVTLRVYLHIIHEDDGSGGLNPEQVEDVMMEMDSTYNEHGIFFAYCIRHINLSAALIDARQISELLYPFASQADGINGYLIPKTSQPTNIGGLAVIGSSNFWAKNTYGTASHELGHCLNLLHTHRGYFSLLAGGCLTNDCLQERVIRPEDCLGNCPEFDCMDQSCVPNCYETGDWLCDTPADVDNCVIHDFVTLSDDGILNYPDWTDACGEHYVANDIIPMNVMSYWRGGIKITPEQACRAHQHISTNGSNAIVPTSDNCPDVPSSCPALSFGTSVWTTHIQFNRNVIINGDLTLDGALVSFARGTSLTVTGDLTIINNSVVGLNNNTPCSPTNNSFWIGIKLNHMATVYIEESTIENSQLGVYINQDPILTDNFPWIRIKNSTFINNFSAIRKSNCSGILQITGSAFLITSTFPLDILGSQVLIASVRGTNYISDCTFRQLEPTIKGRAIQVYDSQLVILGSILSGWDRGIYAKTMTLSGLQARSNMLTDNRISIDIEVGVLRLFDNQFNMYEQQFNTAKMVAVQVQKVNDFSIEDNQFSSQLERETAGLIITDSGANSLNIINNEFTNLSKNIQTYGNNGNDLLGLQFSCNTSRKLNNHPSGSGEYVINGSVLRLQGTNLKPTGNIFAHDCYSTTTDFIYNGSQNVIYYHMENSIPETPDCFVGIDPIPVNFSNPECTITNRLASFNYDELYFKISQINIQIERKVKILDNLLDGGNSAKVISRIVGLAGRNIKTIIQELGPFKHNVSSTVIKTILDLSKGNLTEELIALIKENPSVLGEPSISERVHHLIDYSTLDQSMTKRQELERDIIQLNIKKYSYLRYAQTHLFAINNIDNDDPKKDSLAIKLDQYRQLLNLRQDFYGCIKMIDSYIYESNIDDAIDYVNEIHSHKYQIRNFNEEDLADYMEIITIINQAEKKGGHKIC